MFPPPLFTCSHSRKKLHRCRFVSLEDVKTALQEALWVVVKNGSQLCLQNLKERWQMWRQR